MNREERLQVIADMLAHRCNTYNTVLGPVSCAFDECPLLTFNCSDVTPTDWLRYMQGLEVTE